MNKTYPLVPLLVVRRAADAIDFYVRGLGAEVVACYAHGPDRHVSHADLIAHGAAFAVTEEARAWHSDAPPSLGGTPVVMQLELDDVATACTSLCNAGAKVVFPVQELLGERMARLADPFGHVWLLRERIEELSTDEIQRRRDALFKEASRLREAPRSTQAPGVHLVVGPVGAGKSTFARALAEEHRALRLTLDEWMKQLFSPDRPVTAVVEWYTARAARCVEQIQRVAAEALRAGTSVVLEIGLLRRVERERFYAWAEAGERQATLYIVDAARDVRRQRVAARNLSRGETFSVIVPPDVFELASDLWEPPDDDERAGRDVRFVRTD